MKRALAICAITLISTSVAATSQAPFQFNGEIRSGQLQTEAFGLLVDAGHIRFLDLPSGLRLELAAPHEDNDRAVTHVRLLQGDGQYYRVLHEARTTGSSATERSFTYRVCGAEVTFYQPALTVTPRCEQ